MVNPWLTYEKEYLTKVRSKNLSNDEQTGASYFFIVTKYSEGLHPNASWKCLLK